MSAGAEGTTLEYPRTREMVSVRSQVLSRGQGCDWNPATGPDLLAVSSGVCEPEAHEAPLVPQFLPARSVGAGPAAWISGILSCRCARQLGSRPHSLSEQFGFCGPAAPEYAVTTGRVMGDKSNSFSRVCAWEGLWSVGFPASPFSPADPFSPEFSQCLGSRVSTPGLFPSSLALSRVAINPQTSRHSQTSASHSIIIVCP